tara:strand:- start:510 stop:773 length:264 start_codon:yes stop_codon:yes gene_type:complete
MNMVEANGQQDMFRIRAFVMLQGLHGEITMNMRLTNKAPTCYTLIKREFGLKGSREKVFHLYKDYLSKTYGDMDTSKYTLDKKIKLG